MAVNCKMRTPATPTIDNGIYDRLADGWWHDHGFLNLLRSTLNPWRVPYFTRALNVTASSWPATGAMVLGVAFVLGAGALVVTMRAVPHRAAACSRRRSPGWVSA